MTADPRMAKELWISCPEASASMQWVDRVVRAVVQTRAGQTLTEVMAPRRPSAAMLEAHALADAEVHILHNTQAERRWAQAEAEAAAKRGKGA